MTTLLAVPRYPGRPGANLAHAAPRPPAQARAGSPNALESMDAALRRISEYLDARDEAWADLARVERDAGLGATA